MELLCPDKLAMSFQEERSSSGTRYSPQTLPPVVEMKDPSDDQESLLLIDIPIDCL